MRHLLLLLFLAIGFTVNGQRLIFPDGDQWRLPFEGTETAFKVTADTVAIPRYSLEGNDSYGMKFDSVGNFSWQPSYDLVDRLEKTKEISVIFQAEWKNGKKIRRPVSFMVTHKNRPPQIEELPVFYVKQSAPNQYQISADYVNDPDGDPLTYRSVLTAMPEGASMSSLGLITWTPSRNQFLALKTNPTYIEFTVQDPDRAEAKGRIKLSQTQLDLPPDLLIVPADTVYNIKEDERINIKLYVTDPNGDDNVSNVGFVCNDDRVPKAAMKENSSVQFEFTWSPGYYFVEEAQKMKEVDMIFFALDKSANRVQRHVRIRVNDTENLDEKDKFLYTKYRNSMIQARALILQLDQNHKNLTKAYKQAKKGKKNRSLISAFLGATTGVGPVVINSAADAKVVTALGGTGVMTLGTLEATEVIGKSKSDILDKLKLNVEIRNQLQVEGDNFARKYSLKSARRAKEFEVDREKLLPIINNQKLVILELDAANPAAPKYDNKEIRSTFPDFAEE
ncbi:MAG TPA: Ig domain-containing protein [Cyclobacteriaceae bacterium]